MTVQLYVDLDDVDVSQALYSVLVRLGVDHGQIPPNMEGRVSLYQSVTRNLDLLIVVDGVARVREAAPFQPASEHAGYVVAVPPAQHDSEP